MLHTDGRTDRHNSYISIAIKIEPWQLTEIVMCMRTTAK